MFENVCSLPLPSDLFAQAISPRDHLFAVGLSSGHVHAYKLPPVADNSAEDSDDDDEDELVKPYGHATKERRSSLASEAGYGTVDLAWKTRRHKSSCRSLGFSLDGESLFSAGTDGIVKIARAETGIVEWKVAVPLDS
jgi:WD repeat-containing protein 55